MSGLRNITGSSFVDESNAVLSEIDTFFDHQANNTFPSAVVQLGFYNLLRERLLTLSNVKPNQYAFLLNRKEINKKIEKFLDLESEILNNIPASPQSETYEEIALATIKEQDV